MKEKSYQDYVIKDGKFIGKFEEMYQNFDDPWEQTVLEEYASEKAVCVNLVKFLNLNNIIELGCGFGTLTNRLNEVCPSVIGVDISQTAIQKARLRYPGCRFEVKTFTDFDYIRALSPDCIVMSEISWYVLEHLDKFKKFLAEELPKTYLIHLLTTYEKGKQKYGTEKFTNLAEIKNYFSMNYLESGEIFLEPSPKGSRTYFVGRYGPL